MKLKRKNIMSIVLAVGLVLGAVAGTVALTGCDKADYGSNLIDTSSAEDKNGDFGVYTENEVFDDVKNSSQANDDVTLEDEIEVVESLPDAENAESEADVGEADEPDVNGSIDIDTPIISIPDDWISFD